nr:uncharacterized protein LOC107976709 isoform X5 [Pan troglodytes]
MSNKNPNPKEAELKLHSVSRCSEVTCVISFVFRVFLILLFAPRLLTGWRRGKNFHIHIQNVCQNSLRIFMCMVISSEFCIQSKAITLKYERNCTFSLRARWCCGLSSLLMR